MGGSSIRMWPFVIVQTWPVLVPDVLLTGAGKDARGERLLVRTATPGLEVTSEPLIRELHLPGGEGPMTVVFRYVPIAGRDVGRSEEWVRDEATRRMHMIEGVMIDGTGDDLPGDVAGVLQIRRREVLDAVRGYLDAPVRPPAIRTSAPAPLPGVLVAARPRPAEPPKEVPTGPARPPGLSRPPSTTPAAAGASGRPQAGRRLLAWPVLRLLGCGAALGIAVWEIIRAIVS